MRAAHWVPDRLPTCQQMCLVNWGQAGDGLCPGGGDSLPHINTRSASIKFWTNKIWQPHIRAVQNAVSSLNAGPKDISELHLQA